MYRYNSITEAARGIAIAIMMAQPIVSRGINISICDLYVEFPIVAMIALPHKSAAQQ